MSLSIRKTAPILILSAFLAFGLPVSPSMNAAEEASPRPPYPPSPIIRSIAWHWETHRTAALGSDLWPVTWGSDGHLYVAWGDGGGFDGSNSGGRVSMGFGRIEGKPERYRGVNINGGKNPEHSASFPNKGKTGGILSVNGTLYARINLQDGSWPDVNHVLAWSTNRGATWDKADWVFSMGLGNFQPAKFLNFGRDYTGLPSRFAGFIYIYGPRQAARAGEEKQIYLARVPTHRLRERAAYEFFDGTNANGNPVWTPETTKMQPVFSDPNGVTPATVVYNPGLERFLLTSYHIGPNQLGVFDALNPWGPWTTVAYYEDWGRMGRQGHGLSCEFPAKWISADGLTMWSIFSVYGEGGKIGINAHDKFNLVKVTMTLAKE